MADDDGYEVEGRMSVVSRRSIRLRSKGSQTPVFKIGRVPLRQHEIDRSPVSPGNSSTLVRIPDEKKTSLFKDMKKLLEQEVKEQFKLVHEQLSKTNEQLSKTNERLEHEVLDVKEQFKLVHEELSNTKEELSNTKEELSNTKEELSNIKEELSNTKEELSNTKEELSNTKEELSNTKEELSNTNARVSDLERHNPNLYNRIGVSRPTAAYTVLEKVLERMNKAVLEYIFMQNLGDAGRSLRYALHGRMLREARYEGLLDYIGKPHEDESQDGLIFVMECLVCAEQILSKETGLTAEEVRIRMHKSIKLCRKLRNESCHFIILGTDKSLQAEFFDDIEKSLASGECKPGGTLERYAGLESIMKVGVTTAKNGS